MLRNSTVTHIPAQGKCAKVIRCLWGAKNPLGFVLQDVGLAEWSWGQTEEGGGVEARGASLSPADSACRTASIASNNNTQHLISPFVEAGDVTLVN